MRILTLLQLIHQPGQIRRRYQPHRLRVRSQLHGGHIVILEAGQKRERRSILVELPLHRVPLVHRERNDVVRLGRVQLLERADAQLHVHRVRNIRCAHRVAPREQRQRPPHDRNQNEQKAAAHQVLDHRLLRFAALRREVLLHLATALQLVDVGENVLHLQPLEQRHRGVRPDPVHQRAQLEQERRQHVHLERAQVQHREALGQAVAENATRIAAPDLVRTEQEVEAFDDVEDDGRRVRIEALLAAHRHDEEQPHVHRDYGDELEDDLAGQILAQVQGPIDDDEHELQQQHDQEGDGDLVLLDVGGDTAVALCGLDGWKGVLLLVL